MDGKTLWIALVALLLLMAWIGACRRSPRSAPGKGGAETDASPTADSTVHHDAETENGTTSRAPAASEWVERRERMVETQIASPPDGRPQVRSQKVLQAMRAVPRHAFVPDHLEARAYDDYPLPIGYEQTISQPYIVARMTELLELRPDSKILEVGTGSGYQAAVLAEITPHVYTIEIVGPLAKRARETLAEQGYTQVECRTGDGYRGWPEKAPFDAIIVTCAPEEIPPPLWEQLAPGGRIVIPIGSPYELQRLVLVTKTEEGKKRTRTVEYVRFVPLTRDDEAAGSDAEEK